MVLQSRTDPGEITPSVLSVILAFSVHQGSGTVFDVQGSRAALGRILKKVGSSEAVYGMKPTQKR